MKTSTKIMAVFLPVLVLLVSAGFIYLSVNGAVEPVEFISDLRSKTIAADSFTGIKVNRGPWYIRVVPSDSFYVSVRGGDNIVDNHLNVRVIEDTLVFDLAPEIRSLGRIILNVEVNMPELKFIEGVGYCIFNIHNFRLEEIKTNIKDYCSVWLDSCSISNLYIDASGNSSLNGNGCDIGNIEGRLTDTSKVSINNLEKYNKIELKDYAVIAGISSSGEREIRYTEKITDISAKMASYIDGLKWFMPFDTVITFARNTNMLHGVTDPDSLLKLEYFSPSPEQAFFNVKLNSYNNFELDGAYLFLKRGMLTSIELSFDQKYYSDRENYERIRQSLIKQFGEPNAEPEPLRISKLEWSNNTAWNIKEEIEGDFYTRVELYFARDKFFMLRLIGPFGSIDKMPRFLRESSTTFEMSFQRSVDNTVVGKFKL